MRYDREEKAKADSAREAAKLEALRAAAQVGIDAIERGDVVAFETFEELEDDWS